MSDKQPPVPSEETPDSESNGLQDLVSSYRESRFRPDKLQRTVRHSIHTHALTHKSTRPAEKADAYPASIERERNGYRARFNNAYQESPTPLTEQPATFLDHALAVIQSRRFLIAVINVASLFLIMMSTLVIIGGTGYVWVAIQLPPAEELRSRSLQFATTQILDRDGNLLWEIIDPTGGRRTNVTLDKISPHIINATLATEDRFFYLNVGVDPIAIMRATFDNLSEREIVSGASTITQQLARNVFLNPKERTERSFSRKLREAVLAMEINRRYSKGQILEVYFNQIYYGNHSYGIEAASQTYFGKSARDLTLPEAAMLAGLPQSPAIYDPYRNPDGAKGRQQVVLGLMVEAGYITLAQAREAAATPVTFRDLDFPLEAPHFVTLVREELEQNVPAAYIYQAGLRVYTTLDESMQAAAEQAVQTRIDELADRNVSNGALLAMDPSTGAILALVGSRNFLDVSIDGQVNMITSPRQPASTIKPLTYLAAFERLDWTPSTLLWDVPVEYGDENGNVYRPRNVDGQFHGPVSVRTALANSYNIPVIKTLEEVKISGLKEIAYRLGISTLNREDYGLPLTLGSGEVSLLEMTNAYQAMANQGMLLHPTTILTITDNFGREISPLRHPSRRVLNEAHAYLITDILADTQARTTEFDPDRILQLSRPAAAKTGTTNDFRDSWTIGYTPDIVTGVWVGNADNTAMDEVDGLTGAGHIWHNFMEAAHQTLPVRDFPRPDSIVEFEVCADSGTFPGELCPATRTEIFYNQQPPLGPEHDFHQYIEIDLNTNLRVNQFCRGNVELRPYRIFPPEARAWAAARGIEQPPAQYCPSRDLSASISRPIDNVSVRGTIDIEGAIVAPKISYYELELGQGTKPQSFITIQGPNHQLVRRGLLGTFDTTQVANGPYTLRLVVSDQIGGFTDARIRILIDNPPEDISPQSPVTTPPATYTPIASGTPSLTATATITATIPSTITSDTFNPPPEWTPEPDNPFAPRAVPPRHGPGF
ncbi:MAG: penicillin-binding protein 1C [Anaerolineae bacterium]|nr:penicillin-binding protein 1C [Anaerolineae bacterium]